MSKSSIVVPRLFFHQRLGEILLAADLISPAQVEVVLYDQKRHMEMRFGEILALRGWLKQETSDFFADQWQSLAAQNPKNLLGSYLRQAGLLDEDQIQAILNEQQRNGYKFGVIAVLHGWMKQQTLDFFLDTLYPGKKKETPFIQKTRNVQQQTQNVQSKKQPRPLFIELPAGSDDSPENTESPHPDATIPWID